MSFVKITTYTEILELLKKFQVCFPHLTEKIESLESYAKKLSDYANVYILEDEAVKGLIVYYSNDLINHVGYVALIGILPEYQRLGYGKLLLNLVVKQMQSDGMREVKLEVDNDNSAALEFYKNYGFVVQAVAGDSSTYLCYTL